MSIEPETVPPPAHHGSLAALALGALGVVYGDIGTSPLYTLKTAMHATGSDASPTAALGMFSLIMWTLIMTTSVKYVTVVMRADNGGEGGILALMSLLGIKHGERAGVVAIGILGAALLYGDGAITPAISVLSALEGLKAPLPHLGPYVLALSILVLIGVFTLQPMGSARIGKLFGPVMAAWFLTIAALGFFGVLRHPGVLLALDPRYGLSYLAAHGLTGIMVLAGVFLCSTGAEALYADMGHFGARPIRLTWYALVLPALFLNYAGQTALLAEGAVPPDANPFFELCPPRAQIALVALATAATVIASQAVISGTFSMTRQAVQLGLCPRLHITQTSPDGYGQVYVGAVNWALMALTLGLALMFRSSDNLAAAFGIAVSLTMLLTSMLLFLFLRETWRWSLPAAAALAGLFTLIDVSFVAANLMKIFDGGWVPLGVAVLLFTAMWTWWRGRSALHGRLERDTMPIADFIGHVNRKIRVPGTAVYLTSRIDNVPVPLLHNLKHNKVLHERVVLLHLATENIPRTAPENRVEIADLGYGFYAITGHYGFMEHPGVPALLGLCGRQGLHFDMMQTSFFVGRVKMLPARRSRLGALSVKLFEAMHRNVMPAPEFFHIPPDRVIEIGAQVTV